MMPWVFTVAVVMTAYVGWSCVRKKKKEAQEDVKGTLKAAPSSTQTQPESEAEEKPRVSLYFGSQTGTAEGFAEDLLENGDQSIFNIRVVDIEDADPDEDLAKDAVSVFIMATYGEGDPTDNAVAFHTWITDAEEMPEGCDETQFAVFGLGDTQYENYNSVGRLFQKRLTELGAKCAYPYGEGDTSEELEEDFEKWSKGFWAGAAASLGFAGEVHTHENDGPTEPSVKFSLKKVARDIEGDVQAQQLVDEARSQHSTGDHAVTFGGKPFFHAQTVPVVANRELRKSLQHGSTRHVEIDISSKPELRYKTADNVSICPRATDDLVQKLATRMGFTLKDVFGLVPNSPDAKAIFPVPCSVYQALSMYLNIVSVPKRNLLKHLAFYAADSTEQDELMTLAGEDYAKLRDEHVSIADILFQFPSVEIPLGTFVQMLPTTKPREYTISSSSAANPNTIHVTCSVVEEGLCSNYLDRATIYPDTDLLSSQVDVFVHASTFRLPADPKVPIIMVGPGTGIAPMRAFLQEREFLMSNGSTLGQAVLYFGCRNRNNDDIYADELQAYVDSGVLSQLHVAYSREQVEKIYVQNLVARDSAEIWKLINDEGAHIYVCGGTGMGNDIMQAVETLVQTHGALDANAAKKYVKDMQGNNRYIQELWS